MSSDQQELIDSLREKSHITTTVNAEGQEYAVTTTVKASKFGWYYEITVTPHDRKITTPEEGRHEVPSYDTEAKWALFLQEAAKKHADKCNAISGDIAIRVANRRRLLIATALAGGVLVAVASYFYLRPAAEQVPPSTPAAPEAAVPLRPVEQPGNSESAAPALEQVKPVDTRKIEDILMPPSLPSKSPPSTPAKRLENQSGKTPAKQSTSKEDEIRCIISPKDCQPSR